MRHGTPDREQPLPQPPAGVEQAPAKAVTMSGVEPPTGSMPPDPETLEPFDRHQAEAGRRFRPEVGERITPWDAMHIAIAEDDALSNAVMTFVQENLAWSDHPELRDRLTRIVQQGPPVTKTLYRAEPPGNGSPEGGLRGFRSWTVNLDTADYLGHHMCPRDFVIRTTEGAPVKALSIEDWAYWRGRVLGTALIGGGKQAEYLVLDHTVPEKAFESDVRGNDGHWPK